MDQDLIYTYRSHSSFSAVAHEKSFLLSHCSEIEEDNNVPCFFYGTITNPYVVSRCLGALARTAGAHFALAPGQLAHLKDPIVSVGNGTLHFEAFSSCNSVYARVDVLRSAIDGDFIQSGCTNIDFNDPTVRAFAAVTQTDKLLLGVGSRSVDIITGKQNIVEKKVPLPDRWIRGMGNVQAYLAEMEPAFVLTKIQALQLFKTLPKAAAKTDYFLTQSGAAYSFTPCAQLNSIRIGGIHRLNLLQHLLLFIDTLHVFKHDDGESIAFVLDFKEVRMTFVFSRNVYRGFSGEGRHLGDLIENVPVAWVLRLNRFLKTNETFNPTLVSVEHDIGFKTMERLQASLACAGLLGYDLMEQHHFYRKLPFGMGRLLNPHPRVSGAKKIVENDEVQFISDTEDHFKAEVKGSAGAVHTVIRTGETYQCTCNWYTMHQHNRGLCKHILAVMIKLG